MAQNSHSPDRRSDGLSVLEELIRHGQQRKLLLESTVRTLLVITPLDKPVLQKAKVYYISEPITGPDETREFAPAASQLVEYLGFNNLESDPPGTPAAHLFKSRLWKEKTVFRLTTYQFRQRYENRNVFLVTGKVPRPVQPASVPPPAAEAAAATSSATATTTSSLDDPGFAAVIQAVNSTTLQYQTENRVSFQNVVTDILQAQRVFLTLQDINQALGLVQAALMSFESKVNQWENKFAVFFQQNRPETVGMSTINNLKAQQSKGRVHLRSANYHFGKLISNLEQAKANLESGPPKTPTDSSS